MSDDGGAPPGPPPVVVAESGSPQPAPPLREDQIQNAISFLTHPQVRSSPSATKRSFLERKGLTAAEIEESFKRVPEETSATLPAVATTVAASQQGSGLVTYVPQAQQSGQQPQQQQHMVPVSSQQLAAPQPVAAPTQPEPIRWTQVVLGLSVVAAGVYAVQTIAVPYLASMYRSWTAAMRARQEEHDRHRQETLDAVEVLRKVQEQLQAASESMAEAARALKEQAMSDKDARRELTDAVRELKQTSAASRYATGQADGGRFDAPARYGNGYDDGGFSHYSNGGGSFRPPAGWLGTPSSPQSLAPAAPAATAVVAPAWAAAAAPSAAAAAPGAATAGREATYAAGSGNGSGASLTLRGEGLGQDKMSNPSMTGIGAAASVALAPGEASARLPGAKPDEDLTYPQSFHEVMDMVAKGITPPNVRTDINDKPPDPTRALSDPKSKPMPKPWERDSAADSSPANLAAAGLAVVAAPPRGFHPQVAKPPVAYPPAGVYPLSSKLIATSGPSASSVEPPHAGASLSPTAAAYTPAASSSIYSGAGAQVMQPAAAATTLSVLQPLVGGGAAWKPPSLPEPTIVSAARSLVSVPSSGSVAAGSEADGAAGAVPAPARPQERDRGAQEEEAAT